jgi:hypothetical protein
MDILGPDGKRHRLDERNPPHVYRDDEDNGVATHTEETLWAEVARLTADPGAVDPCRDALDYMTGGIDREPWTTIYREAGGGYDGLQAVARAALDHRPDLEDVA